MSFLTQLHKQRGEGGKGGILLYLSSKRQNFFEYFSVSLSLIIIQVLCVHINSTVCRFCLAPDHVSSVAGNVHIS